MKFELCMHYLYCAWNNVVWRERKLHASASQQRWLHLPEWQRIHGHKMQGNNDVMKYAGTAALQHMHAHTSYEPNTVEAAVLTRTTMCRFAMIACACCWLSDMESVHADSVLWVWYHIAKLIAEIWCRTSWCDADRAGSAMLNGHVNSEPFVVIGNHYDHKSMRLMVALLPFIETESMLLCLDGLML